MDPLAIGVQVAIFFIPFLFSLCFHEFAHGWMAKRKGDNTAEMMGRLTLNPMPHLDWIGTVALPIISIITHLPLFGWAKPVPVNARNLRSPKNDMFWIALAGPASNVLLFFIGTVLVYTLVRMPELAATPILLEMLKMFLLVNLYLAFFNMIPIHPLDGGKVFERFLPRSWNIWLEENQYYLNMGLLFLVIFGGFRYLAYPINLIASFFWTLAIRGAL